MNGLHKEYYPNGKLAAHGQYVNGKKEGSWEWFNSNNGMLWCKGLYENDQKEGLWISFGSDGNNVSEFRYHKGKLHGPMRCFYKGVLTKLGSYSQDKRHGPWEHFFHSGSIMTQGQYVDGLEEGLWKNFAPEGHVRDTCTFDKGEVVARETK